MRPREHTSGHSTGRAAPCQKTLLRRVGDPARLLGSILLLLSLLVSEAAVASAGHQRISLEDSSGEHHAFQVELATTDAERRRGLMYRRSLPEGHGMLFVFDRTHDISMWMKNTYIPLDMVFIGPDCHVVRVVQQTEPLSRESITARAPARFVLEVNAGEAAPIQAGDRLHFQACPTVQPNR